MNKSGIFGLAVMTLSALLPVSCTLKGNDITHKKLDSHRTYTGCTLNGRPHGYGLLTDGQHTLYAGQWRNGRRQGQGVTTDTAGTVITGLWQADTLVSGQRTDSTHTYNGQLDANGQPHGYGITTNRNGQRYEGFWQHGRRQGFGISTEKRHFRVGEWRRNSFLGERLHYTAQRIYGIDISHHQHRSGRKRYPIRWDKLRITHLGSLSHKRISGRVDYKVSFIFIKSTEGTTVRNPYYAADHTAARRHGYPTGSYHFFSTRSPGLRQAVWFVRHSRFAKGDLPPVLDLEPTNRQIKAMGGTDALWREVRLWLRHVERVTGVRPILYVSQLFVNRYLPTAPDIMERYPVWIARYGAYKPEVKLWIWQLAPDGRVAGIHGHVDINVFNGYADEFRSFRQRHRIP